MRAPTWISPEHIEWEEGVLVSDPPALSVYPTGPDDEPDDVEPALFDAKGEPLRYVGKPPFGFTGSKT